MKRRKRKQIFSPICQQSISKQVLGSRERKSIYHILRWKVGQKQYWLACGSSSMSCHVGSIPSATASLMHLFPPSPLLTEISLCIQCSVMGWVRFHISCQCWVYLVISQRESYFPRKPPHVSFKFFAELASPILSLSHQKSVIICLLPHTLSRLRRSQRAAGLSSPNSSGQLAFISSATKF